MKRPCISCGCLIPSGSRCADCKPKNLHYVRGRKGRTASDWTHRKASLAQRKRVPFCELRESPGCTGKAETLDHVLPISKYPEYASAPENGRSSCRPCNASRGDRYSEAEKQHVLSLIAKRTARQASYYGHLTGG
jgi:5-methylcytosine-specific restriction endonuclease McrA